MPESVKLIRQYSGFFTDFWKDFEGLHTVIGKRIKALSENGKLPIEAIDHCYFVFFIHGNNLYCLLIQKYDSDDKYY